MRTIKYKASQCPVALHNEQCQDNTMPQEQVATGDGWTVMAVVVQRKRPSLITNTSIAPVMDAWSKGQCAMHHSSQIVTHPNTAWAAWDTECRGRGPCRTTPPSRRKDVDETVIGSPPLLGTST